MINREVLQGNWNQFKGQIRQKWGQLSDDPLGEFRGNVDELVGVIQQRTGESRESIEKFLQQLTESGSSAVGRAAETVRQYVHEATHSIQGSARQAADQMCEGLSGAKDYVRERPCQSLAACFGAGLIAGILLSMALRTK